MPNNLFTIPAGQPFADVLARGLIARHGHDPLEFGAATVLLPTRRACRTLRDAFLRVGDGRALLLPTIRPLGDVEEDDLLAAPDDAADLPPACDPMWRLLRLAQLVRRQRPDATPALAVQLAGELAGLIDMVETEGLTFDALDRLAPEEYAAHWQHTLRFLAIVREAWPAMLAERGEMNPAARRIALLERLADRWAAAPPSHAVYAAGSTGSIPATAALLRIVAGLPHGAVVLPGFDRGMDPDLAAAAYADANHPQHHMLALLRDGLQVQPAEVQMWPGAASESPRAELLRLALCPADLADRWSAAVVPADSGAGLRVIVAATQREEALAIALLMREALETPGRTAALTTPDRNLARRVAAELRRWGVDVDDSAGLPLSETPAATLLRLTAAAFVEDLAPVALLAMLKHPLVRAARDGWDGKVRALDRALRGLRPAPGLGGLSQRMATAGDAAARTLVEELQRDLAAPLARMRAPGAPLAERLTALVTAVEWLAGGEARLYAGESGVALAEALEEIGRAADELGQVATTQFAPLLDLLLQGRAVRRQGVAHPRLAIWGLLEARLQSADLVILGGLNEGVWPPRPEQDPWFSRDMRRRFGLPSPDRRIALTAHDFVQLAAGPEVVLTRAAKVDGAPTVPARWLNRLDAVLGEAKLLERAKHDHALAWAEALDRPALVQPVAPPAPRPAVALRPQRLSVTRIEALLRDPYAVYAEYILKLKAWDDLDMEAGPLDTGNALHKALERFFDAAKEALPEQAAALVLDLLLAEFAPMLAAPAARLAWEPRLRRIAAWFAGWERARRAAGVRPLDREVRGELQLDLGTGATFTLSAIADRFDLLPDGAVSIVDYKSGNSPAKKQVATGIAPQLTLESAMLAAGAFAGLGPRRPGELLYVRLTGNGAGGKTEAVCRKQAGKEVDAAQSGEVTLREVTAMLRRFTDPATPYLSKPRPQFVNYANDYDHLARYAEWSDRIGSVK